MKWKVKFGLVSLRICFNWPLGNFLQLKLWQFREISSNCTLLLVLSSVFLIFAWFLIKLWHETHETSVNQALNLKCNQKLKLKRNWIKTNKKKYLNILTKETTNEKLHLFRMSHIYRATYNILSLVEIAKLLAYWNNIIICSSVNIWKFNKLLFYQIKRDLYYWFSNLFECKVDYETHSWQLSMFCVSFCCHELNAIQFPSSKFWHSLVFPCLHNFLI